MERLNGAESIKHIWFKWIPTYLQNTHTSVPFLSFLQEEFLTCQYVLLQHLPIFVKNPVQSKA